MILKTTALTVEDESDDNYENDGYDRNRIINDNKDLH